MPDFDLNKYKNFISIVFETDELTEEDARQLIDDTNLYRDFKKLSKKEQIQVIGRRVKMYADRKNKKVGEYKKLPKNWD